VEAAPKKKNVKTAVIGVIAAMPRRKRKAEITKTSHKTLTKKENKMKKVIMMIVFLLVLGSLYGQSEPKVNQVTLVYRHEGGGMGESDRIYRETCIKYRNDGWHDFEFTFYDYSNPSSREWYSKAIYPLETPHVHPSYEVWTVNFEYENQTYVLIRILGNQEGVSTVLRR
jgi:hypothetical protein